jgi:hypothetical protein
MNKMKTLFLAKVGNISKETLLRYKALPYTKICLLYSGAKDSKKLKIPTNIEVLHYTNLNTLSRVINSVYTQYPEYMVIPHFSGDENSRHAIKVYNKTFGSKINPKIFKEKDVMQSFL